MVNQAHQDPDDTDNSYLKIVLAHLKSLGYKKAKVQLKEKNKGTC